VTTITGLQCKSNLCSPLFRCLDNHSNIKWSSLCSITTVNGNMRGPFEKFADSPYYSESEFCGGAMTVSFRSISLEKWCTSYNAPPTYRKRAADRWSLRNFLPRSPLFIVGKAQTLHEARSGLYGECSNGVPPIHFFQAEHRIQLRSRPMRFLGFSNHEKRVLRQEISKLSTVCSTFSRSGWSVVSSASLAKGGTSKKRPSPHLHKVPTRSNVVSPWTLQTALVY
jgi:hypothetical protein